MHHALEIQEILFNIFGYCYSLNRSNLPALARTCRAFKEPALDVLWEELGSLSPLALCLPEASEYHSSSPDNADDLYRRYSFSRPLTQIEWDILRSYTRRIRSLFVRNPPLYGLDWESIKSLSKPPTSEPLLANLRYLYLEYTDEARALFLLPLPSLISLFVQLHDPHLLEDSLESFAKASPNLRTFTIHANSYAYTDTSKIDPSFICGWKNLRNIDCYQISPDVNTLAHFSRMPALTQLCFMLRSTFVDQIAPSDSPLVFSNLHGLQLRSHSLGLVSRFLPHIRMSAITTFEATFESHQASKQDLSSFLRGLQTSGIGHTIQKLWVEQRYFRRRRHNAEELRPVLTLEDLQPCMTFRNLRCLDFNIDWKVDLKDNELLTLGSAWPHLEQLSINAEWGWETLGGITPDGLLQLLQKCPSLNGISLSIDTRGYTESPRSPASLGLTLPRMFRIDVVDSSIEAESVPAIAAFFAGITSRSKPMLSAWAAWAMEGAMNWDVYKSRWDDVYRRVEGAPGQPS